MKFILFPIIKSRPRQGNNILKSRKKCCSSFSNFHTQITLSWAPRQFPFIVWTIFHEEILLKNFKQFWILVKMTGNYSFSHVYFQYFLVSIVNLTFYEHYEILPFLSVTCYKIFFLFQVLRSCLESESSFIIAWNEKIRRNHYCVMGFGWNGNRIFRSGVSIWKSNAKWL